MRFYIVDAFTNYVFGGNPAGIVLLDEVTDFPDESIMQKTAAELRYSETAFLKPGTDGKLHIRFFTPIAEVEFCGHATVAAFAVLLKIGMAEKNHSYTISTLSGDLNIELAEDFIMMEMPSSKLIKHINTPEEIEELYKTLGIPREPVTVTFDNGESVELMPILISTGFPDIFIPVKNRETLANIAPHYKNLSALTKKHGAGGVHAFTLDAPEGFTACCRNFAPLYEINEEAATGTASAGLTYYLHIHGLAPAGHDCFFLQGEAMGRPSTIVASVDNGDKHSVIKVGGKGAMLVEGEIFL